MLTALALLVLALPIAAHAHEVYVLPPETIQAAIAAPAFSEWDVILQNTDQFALWGILAVIVVLTIFLTSISRPLERMFDPFLARLPRYAPLVGRITIGVSFLAAAYYGALFGPELPLAASFGSWSTIVRAALVLFGVMIIIGSYARLAAAGAVLIFGIMIVRHGTYMLTYTNYLGELALLLILGAHAAAVHTRHHDAQLARELRDLKERFAPYAFLILRVAFGISLIYASLYAKVIHNQLALAVATAYPSLVAFFGFEPHFLVLGAAIIEVCLGLFFVFGIEIRFASLFLLFWLSLSLWYFGETVWPHIILIGIPIAFICYGYDSYSLEGRFFKRDGREPVL